MSLTRGLRMEIVNPDRPVQSWLAFSMSLFLTELSRGTPEEVQKSLQSLKPRHGLGCLTTMLFLPTPELRSHSMPAPPPMAVGLREPRGGGSFADHLLNGKVKGEVYTGKGRQRKRDRT